MEYQIRKLSYRDKDHINQICRLLNSSYDQDISRYFIYRDGNYSAYLSNSLKEVKELIYIVIDQAGKLMGFAQLKQQPDALFLNNIIIKPEYRGKNIAFLLLKYIAKEILVRKHSPQVFSLDVFEKNTQVVQWYLRLGMDIIGHKYWYNLMDYYREQSGASSSNHLNIVKDENGFDQVFFGSNYVGTLINGHALVVRSLPGIDVLNELKQYLPNALKVFALITEQELDFPIIDKAFRMSMPLKNLEEI